MGTHPIDAVFPNGVAVSKAAVRAILRRYIYEFDDFVSARTYDLDNTPLIAIAGANFKYDSADFTTADDGATCMVDLSGRRFKKITISVAGETFFRTTGVQGGSTGTHYKVTTTGVPTLSATPVLVLWIPDVNNLGGTQDIKFDAQTAVSLKRWTGNDPAADDILAAAPVILSVTSTVATIFLSGQTA